MPRSPLWTRIATAALLMALLPYARAGGIILYEIATPDVGLASAGYASRADDASTLYKNPAGMSRLEGYQVQAGLEAVYGSVEFSPGPGTSTKLGKNDGGNAIGWMPEGSLFVVAPVGEKVRLGLGAFSYFGLMENYDDNWVGRYYVQNSSLVGMSLMPSASFKFNDWFSLGVGLNAMYGYLSDQTAVNNGLSLADGQMKLRDTTWGVGGNVGALFNIDEKTRVGVNYLSAVKLDFSDTPSFSNLGPLWSVILANPNSVDLNMTVPQTAMISVFRDLDERWSVMADVGWQDWSQFGYVQVGVDALGVTTTNLNFQDTWHGAIGAQYKASEEWVLSCGFAYDTSAVDNSNRTVTLPMGEGWRFGLGAQYKVTENLSLGGGVTFMWCGDMSVNQGTDASLRGQVQGVYEDALFTFFTLNASYRF